VDYTANERAGAGVQSNNHDLDRNRALAAGAAATHALRSPATSAQMHSRL